VLRSGSNKWFQTSNYIGWLTDNTDAHHALIDQGYRSFFIALYIKSLLNRSKICH
jgi:hypothetical protein